MKTDEPIDALLGVYRAAVRDQDVDAFIALYADDVSVFDARGVRSGDGAAARRRSVGGRFGSLGSDRVIVDFSDVHIVATDALASLHGFVRYTAVTAEGVERRAMDNRLTWTLASRDGAGKVVHEPTSAPGDFETAKVIGERR